MQKIPCVILCGGKSSRMGTNKALLPFPDEPLAIFMSKKLSPFFSDVYLCSKSADPFVSYGVKNIVEGGDEFAPMIGIQEGFSTLRDKEVFFISVDTPFVSPFVIETLLLRKKEGVTYAKDMQKDHYLCGIYSREIFPLLREKIIKKEYKMSEFIALLPHQAIAFDCPEVFENLNTPEQYLHALQRLKNNG